MLGRKLAAVTVLVVGVAITGLELAAARILAPFFGSTIFVYGSAIGIALFALSLGYWYGGRLADRRPSRSILGGVILTAGLTAGCIPLVFRPVAEMIDQAGSVWGWHPGALVVIAMGILFILPITALGMASPFVLRLSLHRVEESGRWSGVLSGLATGGSILGTFLATFVTIPLVGTRETIFGSSLCLVVLGAWLLRVKPGAGLAAIIVAAGLGYAGLSGPVMPRPGMLWETESPYQLVQVVERQGVRYLMTDAGDGVQSVYRPGSAWTGTYYDAFALLPYLVDRADRRRSVLIVGLAGGSAARVYREILESDFDFEIVGVEIDGQVLEASREFFGLDRLDVQVVHDDARRYLRTTERHFDVVIVDAYVHELSIPPLLATKEFFDLVADRLAPGGVVGMNAYVAPGSTYYEKFLRTLSRSFEIVLAGPFMERGSNEFILAGGQDAFRPITIPVPSAIEPLRARAELFMRRFEEIDGPVYTDNRTDIELRVST